MGCDMGCLIRPGRDPPLSRYLALPAAVLVRRGILGIGACFRLSL